MIFSHVFPASKTLTQQRSIDEAKIQTHQNCSSVCALSYLILNRRTGCSPILNSFNCMNFLIFWSFWPKNLHISLHVQWKAFSNASKTSQWTYDRTSQWTYTSWAQFCLLFTRFLLTAFITVVKVALRSSWLKHYGRDYRKRIQSWVFWYSEWKQCKFKWHNEKI